MRQPREEVFAALFAQLQKANTTATPFNTMSRRYQPWSKVSPANMPALFVMQLVQNSKEPTMGLNVWTLHASVWVFLAVSQDPESVLSTPLNNYMDAIDAALAPPPYQGKQTLGGLVTNCSIEGDVYCNEGVLEDGAPGILGIPITILTGS